MAGPLNRLPLGLLSLLDLKGTGGRYPTGLGEVIQPELTMLPFFRAEAHQGAQDTIAAASITGANRFVAFPTVLSLGPRIFLAEFTAEADSVDADQAIEFACALAIPFGASLNVYRLGDYVAQVISATGTRPIASAHYQMPRVIPRGAQLGVTVKAFTPGAALNTSMLGCFHVLTIPT